MLLPVTMMAQRLSSASTSFRSVLLNASSAARYLSNDLLPKAPADVATFVGNAANFNGFFRLTGKGVEVRYADGRSSMLSASPDGGVQMMLDGHTAASVAGSCSSFSAVSISAMRRRPK